MPPPRVDTVQNILEIRNTKGPCLPRGCTYSCTCGCSRDTEAGSFTSRQRWSLREYERHGVRRFCKDCGGMQVDIKVLRDHLWHLGHSSIDEKGDQRVQLSMLLGLTEDFKEQFGWDRVEQIIARLRACLAGDSQGKRYAVFDIHRFQVEYASLTWEHQRDLMKVWFTEYDDEYDTICAEIEATKLLYDASLDFTDRTRFLELTHRPDIAYARARDAGNSVLTITEALGYTRT